MIKKNKNILSNKLYLTAVCSLLLFACSTKKNTMVSRAFHNTTSRYNGYFNAREILKENEKTLKSTKVEDYSSILPIFLTPSETESQGMYPDMDKIIEKCSEVIDRHSIYKKKQEHVKWIDDSYLLIGKARMYKMEFSLAEETFLYVFQAYKKDPNRYQGLNWYIRALIDTEQWLKVEDFIAIGEEDIRKFTDEQKGEFYVINADYYLKKDDDRVKAIENLEKAIPLTKKKEKLRRYNFILGQLYQKNREFSRATDYYTNVIKLNPDYVMRFNARINRAIAYDVSSNNSEDIKKELHKMLKDKKNEEFKDQIYYALAELVLKEDNEPLAMEYLKKSTKYSVNNPKQKALSYLKLADLYFERPNYVEAQAHYDSTLQFLPKDHEAYYEAEEKNTNLQDLVKNLKVIILQDSLLALGNLSEKDRKKKIDKLIKHKKQEDERAELAKLAAIERAQAQSGTDQIIPNNGGGRNKGQWYFYNVTNMALGLSEFQQKWGRRPLGDNWNRSKKTLIVRQEDSKAEEIDPELAKNDSIAKAEKYNPDFYLANIPVEFDDQLAANGKIVVALFNVGTIFKESFLDNPSAIKSFKRVTDQYDTSAYNLPAHYQLYRIYKNMNEEENAQFEKDWILENHPFSEYAYLIKNPNYNKESKETKQKVEEFYQATFKLFQYELYADVVTSCNRAESAFSKNHLRPQFAFMKAKSLGYLNDKVALKKQLEYILIEFPDEPVKGKAQEILNFMNKSTTAVSKVKSKLYTFKGDAVHYFVFSSSVSGAGLNVFKNEVSNFNQQYFREDKLQVVSSSLKGSQLFIIKKFSNNENAMRYFNTAENNNSLKVFYKQFNIEFYAISQDNFKALFKSKNELEYKTFFEENYKQ